MEESTVILVFITAVIYFVKAVKEFFETKK